MSLQLVLKTILGVYIAINAYLLIRLSGMLRGTGFLRLLACTLLLLCALSFPLGQILSRQSPGWLASLLITVGVLYIAPMIYAFLLALVFEILRLLNGSLALTYYPPPFGVSGRLAVVGTICALSVLISLGGALNTKFPTVVRRTVPWTATLRPASDSVPERITVALLSDVHLGRRVSPRHLKKLIGLVARENPDILLLVGDFIDDDSRIEDETEAAEIREILSSYIPRLGTWAVLGNHEYYSGLEAVERFFSANGIRLLRDQWATPGGELLLIGRDDRTVERYGGARAPLAAIRDEALRNALVDATALPCVVMDHQPFDLHEAEEVGAHLEVSGHTHRGQLFPFQWIVRAIYECHYGSHRRGDTRYYVSSGAGTWGPPVRTAGRPEVVILTLQKERR